MQQATRDKGQITREQMATVTPQTESERTSAPPQADTRQLVGFSFYRVDPAWRRLPEATRRKHGDELVSVVNTVRQQLLVLTYSLVGMKADVDFLIWRVGRSLDELQAMSGAIAQTSLAGYLTTPYAYLSMTKRSTYVDTLDPDHQDRRRVITPAHAKYLFVYPFVKTREWYQLPLEQRQAMMDEHIKIGNRYPSVRLHTTYSFGLDDQEFVVAFETDQPADFLDLVMQLREARASRYTLRDTPIFSCVAKPLPDILKALGG